MIPFRATEQAQQRFAESNAASVYALSQQVNAALTHDALVAQATAQTAMQEVAAGANLQVPKVNFYPSRHADPNKARRRDIRQAYNLLTPTKRSIFNPVRLFLGRKYRYDKQAHVCVIDGCDCAALIQVDNLYNKIHDEDTGTRLCELYWQNPVTGQPEAFVAKDRVTSGRKMRGTYCPEHLHLYHLLCKWEAEEDKVSESNPRRLRDRMKKGVSMVTVPVAAVTKKDPTPTFLQKYDPFFAELEKDAKKTKGITISHYENPATGLNDLTTITFDLRIFQQELALLNQPTPAFQAMMQGENPLDPQTPPVVE